MIRIEDLLHSLTTVIVRYHDTQRINVLVAETDADTLAQKSRLQAIKILHHETEPYDKRLTELITECTKGYRERSPFLFFILSEISFLKSMLSREGSFTEDELVKYKQQLFQMLIDFGQLLITKKDVTYRVTCSSMSQDKESSKHISLTGLINTAYLGSTLCNSGILLGKEVLERLHLSPTSSREEIEALVENLCTEHQNALLVPELLKKQDALQKTTASLQSNINSLQNKVEELTTQVHKLSSKQLQTEMHAPTIQSQAQKLQRTETQLQERTSSVDKITDKLKRSEASYHELQLKMAETERSLSESASTISDLKEQVTHSKSLITELTRKISHNEETISELNKKLTDGEKIKSTFVYNTLFQKPGAFTRILQAQNSETVRPGDASPPKSGLF